MKRFKTSWRKRAGVTLIEVLAALALLGSLAVAMVLSRGRLVVQHRMAEQKLEAVHHADELLAGWWALEVSEFPIHDDGEVDGREGWMWQTRTVPNPELGPFDAQVVRLRILDTAVLGEPIELTSVDVVLPKEGP